MKKIFKMFNILLLSFLFVGNVYASSCDMEDIPSALWNMVHNMINLIKVLIPIILIIMGMIDMFKSMTSSDDKQASEGKKKFIRRLIGAVMIFLSITLFQAIFMLADNIIPSQAIDCMNCFINGGCEKKYCGEYDKNDCPEEDDYGNKCTVGYDGSELRCKRREKKYCKDFSESECPTGDYDDYGNKCFLGSFDSQVLCYSLNSTPNSSSGSSSSSSSNSSSGSNSSSSSSPSSNSSSSQTNKTCYQYNKSSCPEKDDYGNKCTTAYDGSELRCVVSSSSSSSSSSQVKKKCNQYNKDLCPAVDDYGNKCVVGYDGSELRCKISSSSSGSSSSMTSIETKYAITSSQKSNSAQTSVNTKYVVNN